MTDNEIIKALELCSKPRTVDCYKCPLYKRRIQDCSIKLAGLALDLINRQKAEIEELQSELIITKNNFENAKERYDEAVKIGQKMNEKLIDAYKKLQTAKSEAYKELAERLKEGTFFMQDEEGFDVSIVYVSDIDRTLKKLSEVSDNA